MDATGVGALDARYAFLDEVPDALLDAVVAADGGTLEVRVGAVVAWRVALLDGRLPDPLPGWPEPWIAKPLASAVSRLGLPRWCTGNPEVADAVLRSLLDAVAKGWSAALVAELAELRRLEELERRKVDVAALPGKVRARVRGQARAAGEAAGATAAREAVDAVWGERVRLWAAIEEVFGALGTQCGLGWDMSLGVLRSVGWKNLVRLRALVERLPALREIVRQLGRLRAATSGADREATVVEVIARMRRASEVATEHPDPFVPAETRGVTRSDEVARMLPSEAALLGHRALRMLWHARRVERSLVTYLVEGVLPTRVMVEGEALVRCEERRPRTERGPILVAIDTSGSMNGLPEQVAKAVALEAMRVAHAERRPCQLYLWSGPGQVAEYELSLDPDGLPRLLDFLSLTFRGGTDAETVMLRVLDRVREEAWSRADLLIVSDGEFPVPVHAVEGVRQARSDLGFRVQGVLVGNLSSPAMDALCDAVARFRDWATLAE